MLILAIDPGSEQSGWVFFDGERVVDSGVAANVTALSWLREGGTMRWPNPSFPAGTLLAIEMMLARGMPTSNDEFRTLVWIGRFQQAWHDPDAVRLVYRKDVKMHLCGSMRAKDPNVRAALIELFPATGGGKTPQIGTKGQPGPLYGVSSHAWPALGVAITARHQMAGGAA
jgi:hypothetical protein